MIQPTPGRIVWFVPSKDDVELLHGMGSAHSTKDTVSNFDTKQPLAAIVAYVWNPYCVNLSVIDRNGKHHPRASVFLRQDEKEAPGGSAYAEWMPYQKGQAAKQDKAM